MSGIGAWLAKQGIGGVGDAIGKTIEAVDKVVTSKEEKLQLKNELEKIRSNERIETQRNNFKKQELQIQDKKSARDRDVQINNSEYASWLAKNVMHVLAIIVVGATVVSFFIPTQQGSQELMKICSVIILTFYFGSSLGSKQKTEQIKKGGY